MSSNSYPRSRLRFWSREEGSALSSRVSSPILHARDVSGAYSGEPLLPPAFRDGAAAAVCSPLLLVRALWRTGLAKVSPSTPSDALLLDQATRAASRYRLQSLAVSYLRFTCSEFDPAPTGRQPGRGRYQPLIIVRGDQYVSPDVGVKRMGIASMYYAAFFFNRVIL